MPKELTLMERIRGKRTEDIELPNDTGKIDPRLRGRQPGDVGKAFGKAADGLKLLKERGILVGIDKAKR